MADEKKSDDYDIELGEKNGKSFSPPRPAEPIRYTPAPSPTLANNPVRCGGPILPFEYSNGSRKDSSRYIVLCELDINVSLRPSLRLYRIR